MKVPSTLIERVKGWTLERASRVPGVWPLAAAAILRERRQRHERACRVHGAASVTARSLLPDGTVRGRTVHVLGNGASVLDTMAAIAPGDVSIAINSGALLPLRIDLYMTELFPATGGCAIPNALSFEENLAQMRAMIDLVAVRHPGARLVLKNVEPDGPPPAALDPDGRMALLREVIFPGGERDRDERYWRPAVDRMADPDEPWIVQGPTSVLAAVQIAHRLGASRILVHGLDGRGPHFFHRDGFAGTLDARGRAVLDWVLSFNPPYPGDEPHEPGAASRTVLAWLARRLAERGVEVVDLAARRRDGRVAGMVSGCHSSDEGSRLSATVGCASGVTGE